MIVIVGILLWTAFVFVIGYYSWIKLVHSAKVYVLIMYNTVFLIGIFCLFPFLKGLH